MEGRTRHTTLAGFSLVLSFGLLGCVPFVPLPVSQTSVLDNTPNDGWLISQPEGMTVYNAQGQVVGEQDFLPNQAVQGVLLRPATGEPIVIVKEGETWIVSLLEQGTWTAVYSSKVGFTSCDLSPNGHALVCVQDGDLNLIRFSDHHVQRLDSSVLEAVWSPTNTDLLVSYADHTDLLGLDLDDQVATRTQLAGEQVSGAQFVDRNQLVWWTGNEEQRQLQLYGLRSKQQATLWTGVATPQVWVEQTGNRMAVSDNRTCDPSCTTTIFSLPQGTVLQTAADVIPVGWFAAGLVVAEPQAPIDQGTHQTYHFATLNSDQTTQSLGDGLQLALQGVFHLSFSH